MIMRRGDVVNLGRFETATGERFWAVVGEGNVSVRRLEGPFGLWASRLCQRGGIDSVELGTELDLADLRVLAPLEPGARIFGVGPTYPDQIEESNAAGFVRRERLLGFVKPPSAIIGPDDDIRYPATTHALDFEAEVVLVVGQRVNHGREFEAILGFTLGNDVSPRDVGSPTGDVDLYAMKAQDGMAPLGPFIMAAASAPWTEQPAIEFALTVNGEPRQAANSASMIRSFAEILAWISERNRLRPGDIVFTGTPAGAGVVCGDYLNPGDVVEIAAEGIGVLRNVVGEREPEDAYFGPRLGGDGEA
jgi:2-keto-4-pentenoate hydratase/2-oxohepta-3-ene-1,7-dioic acid hydratase in catechol pathway